MADVFTGGAAMTRGRICSRSIAAGPGSCHYWWDSCPAMVRHCFMRALLVNGGEIDMAKAQEWAKTRDAHVEPEPKLL